MLRSCVKSAFLSPMLSPVKGGVTLHNPADDPLLVSWHKSNDPSTLWANTAGTVPATSTVGQWSDKSVNAQITTQATGLNQPTMNNRTHNGKVVVDFDGADRLTGSYAVPVSGNIVVSGFVIIDSVTDVVEALLSMFNNFDDDIQFGAGNASVFNGQIFGSASIALTGGPYSGPVIFSLVYDWDTTTVSAYMNGVLRGTETYDKKLSATQQILFMANRSGSKMLNGAMGEIIISEACCLREAQEAYLNNEWAVF